MPMHPDHPDANRAESLLPDLANALATGDSSKLKKARTYTEYKLPAKLLGDEWEHSDFTEADLVVRMTQLKMSEQEDAADLGGGSAAKITREMLFASLYQIGDWEPKKDRDRLQDWITAIGPKCVNLLQTAFVKMQSAEEDDIEMFLSSAKKGRG